jgi:hypothetical protein
VVSLKTGLADQSDALAVDFGAAGGDEAHATPPHIVTYQGDPFVLTSLCLSGGSLVYTQARLVPVDGSEIDG